MEQIKHGKVDQMNHRTSPSRSGFRMHPSFSNAKEFCTHSYSFHDPAPAWSTTGGIYIQLISAIVQNKKAGRSGERFGKGSIYNGGVFFTHSLFFSQTPTSRWSTRDILVEMISMVIRNKVHGDTHDSWSNSRGKDLFVQIFRFLGYDYGMFAYVVQYTPTPNYT